MAEIIELEDQIEKVILVGVSEQDGDDAEDSVAELAELVRTAGAVVVGTLIQKRELMHPGTSVQQDRRTCRIEGQSCAGRQRGQALGSLR